MTQYHGKGLVFKIDDAPGGTLRDISAHVVSVDFPRSVDTVDTSTADPTTNSDHKFLAGMRNGTISLNLIWDDTVAASNGPDAILGPSLGQGASGNSFNTFEFGPSGSTTGRVRYTGECIISAYNVTSGIGDAVKATASLQITGPVTRNTWP